MKFPKPSDQRRVYCETATYSIKKALFRNENYVFYVLIEEHKQLDSREMESIHLHKLAATGADQLTHRATRRKGNGPATAALLIQMATEILTASPTLRKRANITLVDLAAADKVRKDLTKGQSNALK